MIEYQFEHMGMYKVVFIMYNTHNGYIPNGIEIKALKIEALLYYVDEEDDCINFATGSIKNKSGGCFNIITVPKGCIVEKPVRLLLQPNLDFLESSDEIIND